MKPVFNEPRLRLIDKLLQKGWSSYLDMAKALNEVIPEKKSIPKDRIKKAAKKDDTELDFGIEKFLGGATEGESYNSSFLGHFRATLVQDLRIILDIYAFAHYGRILKKYGSKEDNQFRNKMRGELFSEKKEKQYGNRIPLELCTNKLGVVDKNTEVTFFKYSEEKKGYSLFGSGDFQSYQSAKFKRDTKDFVKKATDLSITEENVKDVLFDGDIVLEEDVSKQISRYILLKDELDDFAQGSHHIVSGLLAKISDQSEQKKETWVKRVVMYYKNILELVKNPLSNYDPRDVASRIHEFAFFLASENQYHLLGKRFEEALVIYNKLQREQRHLVEDIEQGLVLGDEADVDIGQMKEQMQRDDDSVAAILLSLARVSLDSGDDKKAKELIKKAKGLSGGESLTYAQICHLESVIAGMEGNVNQALTLVDEAFKIIDTLDLENSADGIAILASKAELMQRMGKTGEAKELYGSLLAKDCADDAARETRTSAYLNLAVINLSEGQIEEADRNVTVALSEFQALYGKEPDKHLPNILTAKYIKGLVLMHLGDLESAISILEDACSMVPENRPDLYVLCGAELLEIYVTLHDLYASMGCFDSANDMSIKAKELLTMPAISLSDEQKETIIQRF